MSTAIKLQYLVVGTGRSGTVYVAKLLTAAGFPCSHERIFTGGDPAEAARILEAGGKNSECSTHFGLEFAGPPVAESSYMAVPFLEHEALRHCSLIHVVRDPLKVLRSFLNNILFFRENRFEHCHAQEQFIRTHLPHLDLLPDPASRACYYYLRWNQMVQEAAAGRKYLLYRIETGAQPVLDFLGRASTVVLPDDTCNAYHKWPEHMRVASNLPPISDEEIQRCVLWKEVASLAAAWGYSYPTRIPRLPSGFRFPSQAAPSQSAKPTCYPLQPKMIEANFHSFNLIQYKESFLAVHQELGPLDLTQLSADDKKRLEARGRLLIEESLQALKARLLSTGVEALKRTTATYFPRLHENGFALFPHLVESNYYQYDLYRYLDRWFAVSRTVAPLHFERLTPAEYQSLKERACVLEAPTLKDLRSKVRPYWRRVLTHLLKNGRNVGTARTGQPQ
jgi:hypothetical protein